MNLRNTLRKAAELLVELPPEESSASNSTASTLTGSDGGATDRMWAELEREQGSTPSPPAPTKTVEQIVRDGHGPNLDQIQVPTGSLDNLPGADAGGSVAFPTLYEAANLPTAPFSAEQTLDMIAALPKELPLNIKRQMLRVSLNALGKTMGASPETIVADASRKLAALAAYTENLNQLTVEYTEISEKKIADLQTQIEATRQAVLTAQQKQFRETQACQHEAHRLDEVLEFFSLDVPPSRHAPEAEPASPSPAG